MIVLKNAGKKYQQGQQEITHQEKRDAAVAGASVRPQQLIAQPDELGDERSVHDATTAWSRRVSRSPRLSRG